MSSRDPEALREELEAIDFDGDPELLSELREEARQTVDAQQDTLNDIDTKASRILRLNILLVGVIVSALSVAVQNGATSGPTGPEVQPFLNDYLVVGVGSLVVSTALAAVTYSASELDVGVSTDNVSKLLGADIPTAEAEELLVKNYAVRINFNRSTNIRNTPLITATIVFAVVGILSLTLSVYEGVTGSVPRWLLASAGLLLFVMVWISGLTRQTLRAVWDLQAWR